MDSWTSNQCSGDLSFSSIARRRKMKVRIMQPVHCHRAVGVVSCCAEIIADADYAAWCNFPDRFIMDLQNQMKHTFSGKQHLNGRWDSSPIYPISDPEMNILSHVHRRMCPSDLRRSESDVNTPQSMSLRQPVIQMNKEKGGNPLSTRRPSLV